MSNEETKKIEKEVTMSIASKLNAIRTRCSMSYAQLAELSGKDRTQIAKIESGETSPSVGVLGCILKPLGCELQIVESLTGKAPSFIQEKNDCPDIPADRLIRAIAELAGLKVTIE